LTRSQEYDKVKYLGKTQMEIKEGKIGGGKEENERKI
jgi:hypothetical protein